MQIRVQADGIQLTPENQRERDLLSDFLVDGYESRRAIDLLILENQRAMAEAHAAYCNFNSDYKTEADWRKMAENFLARLEATDAAIAQLKREKE